MHASGVLALQRSAYPDYERGFRVALVFFGIGFAACNLFATLSLKAHGNQSDEKLSCLRQGIFGHNDTMPG